MRVPLQTRAIITCCLLACWGGPIRAQQPGDTAQQTDATVKDAGPTAPQDAPQDTADPGLGEWIRRFDIDRDSVNFKYREPLSPVKKQRLLELYRAYQADLQQIPYESLGLAGQVDYCLMQNELSFLIAQAKLDEQRDQQALEWLPGVPDLIALLERHERDHAIDPKATAELMVAVRKTMAENSLPSADEITADQRTAAIRAAEALGSLERRTASLHRFYSGYDPMYSWWCKVPYEELSKQLGQSREQLRRLGGDDDNPDKIIGQPIGEAAMALELQHELIPYSPAELIEIAEREFEWCDREMLKASRELGFGDDWQAAMEAVKEMHVGPGEQPVMIRDLALEAIDFLEQRDLVTIPALAKESWRMDMMSPARQRLNPFFLGGDTIIVSYPTDTMTHEEKLMSMRGNNEHFSRATVQHELIPGHHLQGYMTDRYRPYRRVFRTPFWIEGWALYWEMLLWDKDFPRSPEDRIGMLFWRKHRCARIVFSLGYQLGRMTPEECVDYLVERVGHERLNADAEVRRSVMGGYGALYQAAYMLGGLQIRALRESLVDSGKMTDKAFHDAILREGPIPITMLRAILTGETPDPNNLNTWRFAD